MLEIKSKSFRKDSWSSKIDLQLIQSLTLSDALNTMKKNSEHRKRLHIPHLQSRK